MHSKDIMDSKAIIEGIKISLTTEELRKHMQTRIDFHKVKVDFYMKQVAALREGGLSATGHSRDPVAELENGCDTHRKKSALFQFMASHLIPEATYILSEHDFARLELVDGYF
jgi:hypothetical protein